MVDMEAKFHVRHPGADGPPGINRSQGQTWASALRDMIPGRE